MNPQLKDALFRLATGIHIELFRRTGGRIGSQAGKLPMLLLTTTGRKSGQPRTVPLAYLADGDRKVLVASFGGDDRHPQWYRNLEASGEATIQIGSETQKARAVTASPEERAELWPKVVALYGGYAGYQKKTTREIPLVILTPV